MLTISPSISPAAPKRRRNSSSLYVSCSVATTGFSRKALIPALGTSNNWLEWNFFWRPDHHEIQHLGLQHRLHGPVRFHAAGPAGVYAAEPHRLGINIGDEFE